MSTPKTVEEYIAKQRAAVAQNPECGTSHYNLAVGLLGQKKYDEAESEFLEAIECSPSLAEAYVQLGGIYLQRGDLDRCLDYNKQAIHSRAGFAEGWGNIGFVQLQKGNVDEAITALEKAIRFNPKFIQAQATLANAYLMNGQIEESIDMNLKVLRQEPNFAVAHNNLAIAYMEKGEFELAAEHCKNAQELGYQVAPEILKELEAYQ
jgi:tetratricopeptide (TPR) repeat protein